MEIPNKDIFTGNKVLLVGYSKDSSSFSRHVYRGLADSGIKVYPYNPNKSEYDVKVYNDYNEIKDIPEVAVVLLNKENLSSAIDDLLGSGIKRLIINNKNSASEEVIQKCKDKAIELNILCPLLIVGTGFHKIHKFFAQIF